MEEKIRQTHATKIKRAYKHAHDAYAERHVQTSLGRVRTLVYRGSSHYTPIVFLHGWGGDLYVWFPVLAEMRDRNIPHILVDLPGFGQSSTPDQPVGVEEYSNAIREGLDLQKVVLVGHSFGGQIAARIAIAAPDMVEKLVLVNAACLRRRNKRFREMVATAVKPLFSLPLLRSVGERILAHMVGDDFRINPRMYETMKKIVAEDLRDELPEITAPTLIIWGDGDDLTPLGQAYVIQEAIPNSLLTVFPDSGHFSFLDKSDEFERALITFITN